jgi:hypothetical protein
MAKKQMDEGVKNFLTFLLGAFQNTEIESKVEKAIKMFRKERNLLFIDKTDETLKAVIKSQTHPEELEYACTIGQDGTYFCCTQNLHRCGGLRGGICKHILLSLIASIKQGSGMDKELLEWVRNSMRQPAAVLDKKEATVIFLKYKNALDGKIEWRPVEVYPEDFMAF